MVQSLLAQAEYISKGRTVYLMDEEWERLRTAAAATGTHSIPVPGPSTAAPGRAVHHRMC